MTIHLNGDNNLPLFTANAVLYHPDKKNQKYTVTVRASSRECAKYNLAHADYSHIEGFLLIDYRSVSQSE